MARGRPPKIKVPGEIQSEEITNEVAAEDVEVPAEAATQESEQATDVGEAKADDATGNNVKRWVLVTQGPEAGWHLK